MGRPAGRGVWIFYLIHILLCFKCGLQISKDITTGSSELARGAWAGVGMSNWFGPQIFKKKEKGLIVIVIVVCTIQYFFYPMPPHVLVVFPPGHGRSVTDFWGWDAHEARLRCPDDVSGTGGCSARRTLKPKFYQPTQTMITAGILPFRENSHGRAGNRTRDLMISRQRLTTRPRAGWSQYSSVKVTIFGIKAKYKLKSKFGYPFFFSSNVSRRNRKSPRNLASFINPGVLISP